MSTARHIATTAASYAPALGLGVTAIALWDTGDMRAAGGYALATIFYISSMLFMNGMENLVFRNIKAEMYLTLAETGENGARIVTTRPNGERRAFTVTHLPKEIEA